MPLSTIIMNIECRARGGGGAGGGWLFYHSCEDGMAMCWFGGASPIGDLVAGCERRGLSSGQDKTVSTRSGWGSICSLERELSCDPYTGVWP